jgi:hypothetical protein
MNAVASRFWFQLAIPAFSLLAIIGVICFLMIRRGRGQDMDFTIDCTMGEEPKAGSSAALLT